jgi:hypothetical protein
MQYFDVVDDDVVVVVVVVVVVFVPFEAADALTACQVWVPIISPSPPALPCVSPAKR